MKGEMPPIQICRSEECVCDKASLPASGRVGWVWAWLTATIGDTQDSAIVSNLDKTFIDIFNLLKLTFDRRSMMHAEASIRLAKDSKSPKPSNANFVAPAYADKADEKWASRYLRARNSPLRLLVWIHGQKS